MANERNTHHVDERPEFDVECSGCGSEHVMIHSSTVPGGDPLADCDDCPWHAEIPTEAVENVDMYHWTETRERNTLDYEQLMAAALESEREENDD